MTKQNWILIVVIALAAIGIVYLIYINKKNTFQWYESYDPESDQPYGTKFIYEMLESYRPNGKFVLNKRKSVVQLLDSAKYKRNTDYVMMGFAPYFDSKDLDVMANFIERGNNVFLATQELPYSLILKIYKDTCNTGPTLFRFNAESAKFNFYHDTLRTDSGYTFRHKFQAMHTEYSWAYLGHGATCDSSAAIVPLGNLSYTYVNFFKIPYGDGALFVHTNPIAFTNYFMLQPDKTEYASGVFSHLTGENIIWDEFSKLPFSLDNNDYNSPLYFIMQQPSLKYAWWMMLVTVIVFVVFAAKRKQRVIPVIEPKQNTSLEFVTMIASLHFQNSNHLDMARKKMKYFLYFIRTRYGIQAHALTLAHVPILAERSGVNQGIVKLLYEKWNIIAHFDFGSIEEKRLVDLYQALESFYKNCK